MPHVVGVRVMELVVLDRMQIHDYHHDNADRC